MLKPCLRRAGAALHTSKEEAMSRSTARTAALVAVIALAPVLDTRFGGRRESNPTRGAAGIDTGEPLTKSCFHIRRVGDAFTLLLPASS